MEVGSSSFAPLLLFIKKWRTPLIYSAILLTFVAQRLSSTGEFDMYVNDEGKMIQPLAQPGDFKFADRDGDGQITDNDRAFMGTPQPDCSFGLNLYFGWKNFDLTLFFNGQFGNQIYNSSKSFYGKLTKCNILVDLYENSWRKEGDLAKYPRITGTDLNNNYKNSSW